MTTTVPIPVPGETDGWRGAAPRGREPRRRPRRWPWLVALVVVLGLLVVAWFIAESLARGAVTSTVRSAIIQKLDLPENQKIDVDIGGMVIPQLVGGTFHDVHVASDNVPISGTAADVSVTLHDVMYRGTPGKMSSGQAVVTLSEKELRGLVGQVGSIPASAIGLKAPDVTASTSLSVFGAKVPVGIALRPSAKSGDLVFSPESFSVAQATLNASDLSSRFGSFVDGLTQARTVCIADKLPKGIMLSAVKVSGSHLVADLVIDPNLAVDSSLRQKGACS